MWFTRETKSSTLFGDRMFTFTHARLTRMSRSFVKNSARAKTALCQFTVRATDVRVITFHESAQNASGYMNTELAQLQQQLGQVAARKIEKRVSKEG